MIYVVSGLPRSGTSMLMAALDEGGLPAHFEPARERLREAHGDADYDPNAGGMWELSVAAMRRGGFEQPDHCHKIVTPWLCWLRRCDRAVIMLRDPEEIRQSYEAFFGMPYPPRWKDYHGQIEQTRQRLESLGGDVCVLEYRRVIEAPLHCFAWLADRGWPIDPAAAAAVVDPDRYRYRLESLDIGV